MLIGTLLADASMSRLIDLSYRHNLGADVLLRAIPNDEAITVDVSSTALGDNGLLKIVEKLLMSSSDMSSLSLIAQSNELSAKGATKIFQSLLSNLQTNISNSSESRGALNCLDLSWNNFDSEDSGESVREMLHDTLEHLIGNSTKCPASLRFDRCGLGPAAMRAIGIGLIHRYTHQNDDQNARSYPLSLSLCGNPIGDAGAAALAAAIRFVATSEDATHKNDSPVFEKLDLSACGIGDAGAEAIALALESATCCMIKHLDLSNNGITERGVEAICRGLAAAGKRRDSSYPLLQSLDLSNNKFGDAGAKSIGLCIIESELVPSLILRSCFIQADGATALGTALRNFVLSTSSSTNSKMSLDLSGNPFGILRGKTKQGGGKYSASHLKSKASATAASYMNQGFSFIKKGLKDVGVEIVPSSGESDDEEEQLGRAEATLLDGDIDPSRAKCGGKALSTAFTSSISDTEKPSNHGHCSGRSIHLGLRHCCFDHAAAEALADMIITGKDELRVDVELDIRMNDVLEEEMLSALHGGDDDYLREMAESHADKMSFIKDAQQRAREALVAARSQLDPEFIDSWADPVRYSDAEVEEEEEKWDSDADYENEDEP